MATRQGSFRARPIDVTSQLALLRDPEAIKDEQVVQREVTHAHKALDKENEEVLTKETTAGVSEIPIPEILPVASYETDYPTNFKQPEYYLRSKLTCDWCRVRRQDTSSTIWITRMRIGWIITTMARMC